MTVIIDFRLGNVGSLLNMLNRIGGPPACISDDPGVVAFADRLLLPGVGAFDYGMQQLHDSGLLPAIQKRVLDEGVPLLGICLGFQMLTRRSDEGALPGLGWIPAETRSLRELAGNPGLRVPHMGWNSVKLPQESPLFVGLEKDARFYFVHSYAVRMDADNGHSLAETDYAIPFVSAAQNKNVQGVQFHPEKSHHYGKKLLSNFCGL